MTPTDLLPPPRATPDRRETEVFEELVARGYDGTLRLFAGLLIFEWLIAIGLALWLSPKTWTGAASGVHPHVWLAVLLGGVAIVLPIFFCLKQPQEALSRHSVAIAQMLMGSILIHITGGRIETHFHVFCSLALLAFFRDYRVLITASIVVVFDHLLRGIFWPESVYGVLSASIWRTLEHGLWVVIEDAFLTYLCFRGLADLRAIARHQLHLENAYQEVENKVLVRTSELQRAQKRLRYRVRHDSTTGLPNRLLFADRLRTVLSQTQPDEFKMAILFLDLDRFKQINDALGHDVGDEYLKQVSRRFKTCLRKSDLLARIGGDEFAILLRDLDGYGDAATVAANVLDGLVAPVVVGPHQLCAAVSIGISVYPADTRDGAVLLRNADHAMYQAKRKGKNRYEYFTASIGTSHHEAAEMETYLRDALEKSEFELYYQPQYDVEGRIVALEALVRFNHPELGLVPPGRFIPIAEESGLIVPIGLWVLEEACRQSMAWQAAGYAALRVAINVSALQFTRPDFSASVEQALRSSGLAPDLLELEITESVIMTGIEESANSLARLRAVGVRIAIDDFGTGYSSLSYLQALPVTNLKIDQSFVRKLDLPGGSSRVVRAIIALAHSSGLAVTAEGVETSSQLEILRAEGADLFQGFYFSKPARTNAVERLLPRLRVRTDGYCGAGAPRFNVVTTDNIAQFVGCKLPARVAAAQLP